MTNLDIPNNFKCCLEQSKRLKITFEINSTTNHYSYYELILKRTINNKKKWYITPIISDVHCVADKCYGRNGTNDIPAYNFDRKMQTITINP